MMENGLSVADAVALGNNDGFGNGNAWFWIVVLFLFGWGGNGFGGNSAQTNVLDASMQRGFDNQNIMQRFDTISQNQTNAAYDNAVLIKDSQYNDLQNTYALTNTMNAGINTISGQMCEGFHGVDKSICQSTYATTQAMNDGFNSVNQNLNNLSHQISDGVCAIKTQMLQDKYDHLLNEYNIAVNASANAYQTQNILSAIGSWYAKPPYAPVCPVTYAGTTIG